MANRLPEKLTSMRKQLGLSQGDIAAKMNIPVAEYMHWENGTSIPSIQSLKKMADIFGIKVVMLVDNTVEPELPQVSTESVEIPFINPPAEETKTMNLNSVAELGTTKQVETIDTLDFQPTVANQIVDDTPMEMTQSRPIVRPAKPTKKQRRKTALIITGVAAAALALVFGLIFLLRGGKNEVALSGVNRLALGDTYSLYIKKSGELEMNGQFADKNLFDGAVQVSAYNSHAVALKSDGTVVTNGDDSTVSGWKNAVRLAAGRTHTAAVTEDGEVLCTGSDAGCQVSGWANITSLYAGNAVTLGISSDGTVHASGADQVDGISGIKSAAIGDSQILLVSTSGTVKSYSLTDASPADASGWSDIDEAAVGSNFVAGMTSKGKVVIVTDDEDLKEKVESWSDIRYIAASGNTLIAVDRAGTMHGAGDNSHGQYVDTPSSDDKDKDAKQLDMVKDISFSETTANVQIKWKTVKNADYYTVKVEPALSMDIPQTSSTSVSIPASEFSDGEVYQVTITAYSNNSDKYESSEPAVVSYTFKSRTVTLDTPSNVTCESTADNWIVRWEPTENATYYMFSLDGQDAVRTEQNAFFFEHAGFMDQSLHTVSITACSDSSSYSDSVPAEVELTYQLPSFSVTLNFDADDGASFEHRVVIVKAGSHTLSEIVTPDLYDSANYQLSNPDRSVDVYSDYSVDVSLTHIGGSQEEGGE